MNKGKERKIQARCRRFSQDLREIFDEGDEGESAISVIAEYAALAQNWAESAADVEIFDDES